jgi:hypothetical protein
MCAWRVRMTWYDVCALRVWRPSALEGGRPAPYPHAPHPLTSPTPPPLRRPGSRCPHRHRRPPPGPKTPPSTSHGPGGWRGGGPRWMRGLRRAWPPPWTPSASTGASPTSPACESAALWLPSRTPHHRHTRLPHASPVTATAHPLLQPPPTHTHTHSYGRPVARGEGFGDRASRSEHGEAAERLQRRPTGRVVCVWEASGKVCVCVCVCVALVPGGCGHARV